MMYYDGVLSKPPLDELFHHGILGMKWGVRNGPPYPLKDGQRKTNPQSREGGVVTAYLAAAGVATLLSLTRYAITKASRAGVKKAKEVARKKDFKEFTERSENAKIDKKTGLKLKSNKDATPDEDMKAVNVLRGSKEAKGSYNNCTFCTTAYDLRRRGFDVIAGSTPIGTTQQEQESWYKGGKFTKVSWTSDKKVVWSAKPYNEKVLNELSSQKNSRGRISVYWNSGSGHSMVYEVNDGKVTIRDCQSNKSYEGNKAYKLLENTLMGQTSYMRTDNLEPNYKLLKEKGIIR